MYTLIKIHPYDVECDLYFKNTETGKIDMVFDDEYFKKQNFSFLKQDEDYDCKFMLCGKKSDKNDKDAKCCRFISREMIGLVEAIKTEQEGNVYYLSANGLGEKYKNEDLYIRVTRIDLVEVNNVVHHSFLNEILAKYL